MKLEQKRTKDGMFFVVFVSTGELEYDYPHFTRMFIRDAAEEPTVRKTLMALEAMESILEEAEARNKNWQEVIDYGGENADSVRCQPRRA